MHALFRRPDSNFDHAIQPVLKYPVCLFNIHIEHDCYSASVDFNDIGNSCSKLTRKQILVRLCHTAYYMYPILSFLTKFFMDNHMFSPHNNLLTGYSFVSSYQGSTFAKGMAKTLTLLISPALSQFPSFLLRLSFLLYLKKAPSASIQSSSHSSHYFCIYISAYIEK